MAAVWRCVLYVALIALLLMVTSKPVSGDFVLMVNLVNYTNPSGLCAECQTNTSTLGPVCCDELPYKSDNCDNTGDARCDTRFRWTIRPFGATLETRPTGDYAGFTDCTLSPSTCPFSDVSEMFNQGPGGILNVTDNPLVITSRLSWTGRIQFYIEPLDSGLPYIIDSLLVNLDSLQLGGNFTEEMVFTGFHNISTMTMSFRVQCSSGFCGPDCRTIPTNNPLVAECQADGSVTCVDSKRDPSLPVPCSDCLYNLDSSTNCSTCLQSNYDPDNNCMTCLPNYDIATNCSMCTNRRYDQANNCQSCLDSNFNPLDECTSCLLDLYDPRTNCTQCLPNRNTSTNCTQCLPDWDVTSNCTKCLLPNRNPDSNCTQCLGNRNPGFTGNNCERDTVTVPTDRVTVPTDTVTAVDTALIGGIAGGVSGVLLLIIVVLVILVCVLMCQVTKRGHVKFVSDEGTATNAYNMSAVGTGTRPADEHKFQNPLYSELDPKTGTGSSDDHAFTNSLYESVNLHTDKDSQLRCPDITPPSHTVKTDTSEFTSTLDGPSYDTANYRDGNQPSEGGIYDTADHSPPPLPAGILGEDYSKLRQPTATNTPHQSPASGTLDPSLDQPVYDEAFPPSTVDQPSDKKARLDSSLDQPVYDKAFPPTVDQPSDKKARLDSSLEQPVYDEAFPPTLDQPSEKKARHPSKSAAAYEEIKDEDIQQRDLSPPGVYDKTFPPPANLPSENTYSKLGQLEPELPAYDVANNNHPQQLQPKGPPPTGSAYDTANYCPEQKTKPRHEYIETSEFLGAPKESPSHTYDYADANKLLSPVKHSYDYIDTPLSGASVVPPAVVPPAVSPAVVSPAVVPPAVVPSAESVYTNTTPGQVSIEAESHYDMGQ